VLREKDQMNRYVIPTVVEQYPLDRGGLWWCGDMLVLPIPDDVWYLWYVKCAWHVPICARDLSLSKGIMIVAAGKTNFGWIERLTVTVIGMCRATAEIPHDLPGDVENDGHEMPLSYSHILISLIPHSHSVMKPAGSMRECGGCRDPDNAENRRDVAIMESWLDTWRRLFDSSFFFPPSIFISSIIRFLTSGVLGSAPQKNAFPKLAIAPREKNYLGRNQIAPKFISLPLWYWNWLQDKINSLLSSNFLLLLSHGRHTVRNELIQTKPARTSWQDPGKMLRLKRSKSRHW
jgi:hypothetical protein